MAILGLWEVLMRLWVGWVQSGLWEWLVRCGLWMLLIPPALCSYLWWIICISHPLRSIVWPAYTNACSVFLLLGAVKFAVRQAM